MRKVSARPIVQEIFVKALNVTAFSGKNGLSITIDRRLKPCVARITLLSA